jgi:hypothetical protein
VTDHPIELAIHQIQPHPHQQRIKASRAKRKIVRAGRRGGKTCIAADIALDYFLDGHRVLYATPTSDQITRFWYEVTTALREPIDRKYLDKNETEHSIEVPRTLQRIRAKTAWNAETLRGDYGDLLVLDEFQLMNEDAWGVVGAPMLLDNNGDAILIYTPPSIRTAGMSKAQDPRHAAKLFKEWARRQAEGNARYAAFSFTSHDNPYISKDALAEITQDMSRLAYEQEILAQDKEDNPAALFKRTDIDDHRVTQFPELSVIVVGVDPTTTSGGDECGIVADGEAAEHLYVLSDDSLQGSPETWARAAVTTFHKWHANFIVAEKNQGGEMVEFTIHQIDASVPVKLVHASQGKEARAEPIVPAYEQGRAHHVGLFPFLEDEMCQWQHGMPSPNRLDAHVYAASELLLTSHWYTAEL